MKIALIRSALQKKLINICYNLSKCLGLSGRYTESIDIAREGIDYCKYANDVSTLPLCMYNYAWSLTYRNENNDREKAKQKLNELSEYCTPMTKNIGVLIDGIRELYKEIET